MECLTSSVGRFLALAGEDRFRGWPLVGEPVLGAKIPYFGQVLEYKLKTGNGVDDYASILRHFGWVVVFGVTLVDDEGQEFVNTLCQWKPGVNRASWELPPGGIGKVAEDISPADLLEKTQASYLKETGYGGGVWQHLGHTMIETGKFRGATPDGHGLPAHMYLATGLVCLQDARRPNPNEIMETLMVPLPEFRAVLESGHFTETSAVACAYAALVKLGMLQWA